MFKIVSIRDVGAKVEIIGRGVIRTPINKILLTDEQIYRLLNTHMGPKQVFLLNPANENQSVRLTLENCTTPVEEIFGAPKAAEVAVEPEKTETYTLDDVTEPETADETVAEVAEDPQSDVELTETDVVATEPEAPVVEEEEAAPLGDPADVFVTGTVVGDVDETAEDEVVTTVAETAEDTEPAQKPTYYKNNYKKNNYKKN